MRIAQIAPLEEAVPPKLYGGTERIVSYLTEALVEAGHDVTLFASGDSETSAKLESCWPHALRLNSTSHARMIPHILLMEKVFQRAHEFDVLHFHVEFYQQLPLLRCPVPSITTVHGSLHFPEMQVFYNTYSDAPLVSISDKQRQPIPRANWLSTVYHGLPEKLLTPTAGAQPSYLAFLGRITPDKRVDRAVRIAEASGMRLRVAAKVDSADRNYYEREVESMLKLPHVDFIGEICEEEKSDFLSNAHALLFPIDWEEPFGLVMIEAMACGTPIIAWGHGSVPEVIGEGVTGFIVHDEAAAAEAVERAKTLSRSNIRKVFEQRFSSRTMADGYVATYGKLLSKRAEAEKQRPPRLTSPLSKRPKAGQGLGGFVQHLFGLRTVDASD